MYMPLFIGLVSGICRGEGFSWGVCLCVVGLSGGLSWGEFIFVYAVVWWACLGGLSWGGFILVCMTLCSAGGCGVFVAGRVCPGVCHCELGLSGGVVMGSVYHREHDFVW